MVKLARTHPHAARRSRLYITAWAAVAIAATRFKAMGIQKSADVNSFHAPHGARPITPCYRSFAESRGGSWVWLDSRGLACLPIEASPPLERLPIVCALSLHE